MIFSLLNVNRLTQFISRPYKDADLKLVVQTLAGADNGLVTVG